MTHNGHTIRRLPSILSPAFEKLSETRKKRFMGIFRGYDIDGDGVLRGNDFDGFAKNLSDALGLAADDPKRAEVLTANQNLWKALVAAADTNGDGIITPNEFVNMYAVATEGVSRLEDTKIPAVHQVPQSWFKAVDRNGDGVIDLAEYSLSQLFCKVRIPHADPAWVVSNFNAISQGKPGIDFKRHLEIVSAVLFSEDEATLSYYPKPK